MHFANIAVSEWILNDDNSDECAWYFFNFFIDCTLGVGIVCLLHSVICHIAIYYFKEDTVLHRIGDYGEPPQMKVWLKQFGVYLFALLVNKAMITVFLYVTKKQMTVLGNWLFWPLQSQPDIELVVVMIICPLILTSFQYWIFDIMLKNKNAASRAYQNI